MAGLTDQGFEIKRLAVILSELKAGLVSAFGDDGVEVQTHDESGLGLLAGIMAKQLAEIWELAQAVYASQYPATAAGAALANVLALSNLTPKAATPSTLWQLLAGDAGTVIPSGSIVEHAASQATFETTEDVTLDTDAVVGATITITQADIGDTYTVTIDGYDRTVAAGTYESREDVANAVALEIDPETPIADVDQTARTFAVNGEARSYFAIGKRCRVEASSDNDGVYTVAGIAYVDGQTVITVTEAIPGVTVDGLLRGGVAATNVGAVISLVTYPLPDGASDASDFAVSVAISWAGDASAILTIDALEVVTLAEATSAGPTAALVDSVTVIGTPVSGWDSTTNVLAADVGNLLEMDVEARQRRSRSLASSRLEARLRDLTGVDAATVYENATGTTDSDGRPGHSLECVVVGGTDADIAQCIFENKAAGITAWGTTLQMVTDEQGFQYAIRFSRPVDVLIHVKIIVVTLYTEEDLPASPADAIAAAVLAYGATLVAGKDVISGRIEAAVTLGVPGLSMVSAKIGLSPNPTTATPISITPAQTARFALERITVTGV